MRTTVLSVVLVVLAVAGGCSAAKCYSCNYARSGNDVYENFLFDYKEDCGDPFKQSNISTVNCKNDCYKAVVDLPDEDVQCISRGCFPSKTCTDSDTGKLFVLECGGQAYETQVHCCTEGKCNAAPVMRYGGLLLIFGLLFGYIV